ncbi:unnamed protein product, partial [Closterium sp. NIES-53]
FSCTPALDSLVAKLQVAFPTQKSEWCIVKTHLLSHYIPAIRRAGHVSEFSTNMWEHLHGPLLNTIYRRSNKRNVEAQIMKHHEKSAAFITLEDEDGVRYTIMQQAMDTRRSVMTKESEPLDVLPANDPTSAKFFVSRWSQQHPSAHRALPHALAQYGITVQTIQ